MSERVKQRKVTERIEEERNEENEARQMNE